MINKIRFALIRLLAGKSPVALNLTFRGTIYFGRLPSLAHGNYYIPWDKFIQSDDWHNLIGQVSARDHGGVGYGVDLRPEPA